MEKLIQLLKKETESLLIQYTAKCVDYAHKQYKLCQEKMSWSYEKWVEVYPANYVSYRMVKNVETGLVNKVPTTSLVLSKQGHRDRILVTKISRMLLEDFIKNAENKAKLHYDNSIIKLASRIESKGLDLDNLKLLTSHVGVNIETVITDSKKIVKAFTIIAEGPLRQPHYRYLIK